MLKYLILNVNPKQRRTADCSTRAIVGCLGIDYNDALDLQVAEVKKSYYDFTSQEVVGAVLKRFGYEKMKQPRKADKTKYKVCEMDKILTKEQMHHGVVLHIAHHFVAIKNGEYIDIWNCGDMCVGRYYVKVR